jgi:hypothetical protein
MATKLINYQPVKTEPNRGYNPNRFNLEFLKESPDEVAKQKKHASKELIYKDFKELEVDINEIYPRDSPLDMPIRPPWSYQYTKEQIEQNERKYFVVLFFFKFNSKYVPIDYF